MRKLMLIAGIILSPGLSTILSANMSSSVASSVAFGEVVLKGDAKKLPPDLQNVGVHEHLAESIQLDSLQFTNALDGKLHPLREYFSNGKPVVLNLVYYECPMLCTMVLNGVTEGLKGLDWTIGKEFDVVTISINPKDTPALALKKRESYLKSYLDNSGRDENIVKKGWQFFTATDESVKALADQLGFLYQYDSVAGQYAHAAVTFILTPEGKISRYLYGIEYRPRDLRFALLEAAQGKVGSVIDRILMFCYHYDPASRGYSFQAFRVMQVSAAGTILLLGVYLALFWTRQKKLALELKSLELNKRRPS